MRSIGFVGKIFILLTLLLCLFSSLSYAVDCYTEIDSYYYTCADCNVPSHIHIHTKNDITTVRNSVIDYLWPQTGFPSAKMPVDVTPLSSQIDAPYDCSDAVSPDALSGLVLWLDADDAGTVQLQQGKVAQWQDKSGQGNHAAQPSGTQQPLYVTGAVNGKAAVRFDGTDDFLDVVDNASIDLQNMTVVMVISVSNPDNVSFPCPLTKMPVNQAYLFVIDSDNIPLFRVVNNGQMFNAKLQTTVDANFDIWTGKCDGSTVSFSQNSGLSNSTAVPGPADTTDGNLRLGDASGGNFFAGDIAELLVFNRALSAAEQLGIEAYLGCKYDIAQRISQDTIPSWVEQIGSDNIGSVRKLDIEMDYQMHSYSYLIEPQSNDANCLLIFHQGHGHNLLDYGGQETMKYFLDRGFTIMTFWMPLFAENSRTATDVPGYGTYTFGDNQHNVMSTVLENSDGSFIRFFVEPVMVGINYALADHEYRNVYMTGISGGGWTTHLCSALDTQISLSFPTAGSLPLYLRSGPCANGSEGDAEQTWPALYEDRASWLDLYILAGYGFGRGQTHVLNQYDACCFGGINYKTFEPDVTSIVDRLGSGFYRVYLDTTHSEHKISQHAIETVIYPRIQSHLNPQNCSEAIESGYRYPVDFNSDCRVNMYDFMEFSEFWLSGIDFN